MYCLCYTILGLRMNCRIYFYYLKGQHILYIIILHSVQNVHFTIKVTDIFSKLWKILHPFFILSLKSITKC